MGYPEPVHLLGTAMLSCDNDNYIDDEDFKKATSEVINDRRKNELEAKLKQAGSGKYQLILQSMAKNESDKVPLASISNDLGIPQNEYSTNISNLIKKEIITKEDRGVYSFVDPLLKEYIRSFGIIKNMDEAEDE